MDANTMIFHLKDLYDKQSRMERYDTSKQLHRCKVVERSSVIIYVLKMIGHIEKLTCTLEMRKVAKLLVRAYFLLLPSDLVLKLEKYILFPPLPRTLS